MVPIYRVTFTAFDERVSYSAFIDETKLAEGIKRRMNTGRYNWAEVQKMERRVGADDERLMETWMVGSNGRRV